MEFSGCLRCDTGMSYYTHDHRNPPNPGTTYLDTDGLPDGTQE